MVKFVGLDIVVFTYTMLVCFASMPLVLQAFETAESPVEPTLIEFWNQESNVTVGRVRNKLLKRLGHSMRSLHPKVTEITNLLTPSESNYLIHLVKPTLSRERASNSTLPQRTVLDVHLGVEDLVIGNLVSRLSSVLEVEARFFSKPTITVYQRGQGEACHYDVSILENSAQNVYSDYSEYEAIFDEGAYVVGENPSKLISISIPLRSGPDGSHFVFPLSEQFRNEEQVSVTTSAQEQYASVPPVSTVMCDSISVDRTFFPRDGNGLVVRNTRPDTSVDLGSLSCMCPVQEETWVLQLWVHSEEVNPLNNCHLLLNAPFIVSGRNVPAQTFFGCQRAHIPIEMVNPFTSAVNGMNPLTSLRDQSRPEFTYTFFISRYPLNEPQRPSPLVDIGGSMAFGVDSDGTVFMACRDWTNAANPKIIMKKNFEDPEAVLPRDGKYHHVAITIREQYNSSIAELALHGEEIGHVELLDECFVVGNSSSLANPTIILHMYDTELAHFNVWGYPLEMPEIVSLYESGREMLPIPPPLRATSQQDTTPKSVNRRFWGARFANYPFDQFQNSGK